MKRRRAVLVAAAACLLLGLVVVAGASSSTSRKADPPPWARSNDDPAENVAHDVSAPLRDLTVAPAPSLDDKKEKEPKHGAPFPDQSSTADPVVQTTQGTAAAPVLGAGFEGVGQGFSGPQGTFSVSSAPPDPNSAVGPNHVVEVVNQSFAVFDKSGNPVYGPVPTNTVWSGFGGGCQANDDGDAIVEYDKAANRWIISQFSVSNKPYLQCVAVSTSGDPTGSYARYSFSYGSFPDYPKLGVWPDAYYVTFNMFGRNGSRFTGPQVCAYDRAKMLAGQAATQQCFLLSTAYGSLLPSDLDGSTPPPAGSPNYLLSFATNSLQLWKFHVDWANTANTTLTGPTTIPVAAFSPACGGGACIPQAGTSQTLDSLADRLMYRLVYRNFGDHESLVVNHSVVAGSSVGVRWYELRSPGGSPTVYQQGTYAPDSSYRWMGSAAMDGNGDIALGYSVSSASQNPGIRYTARLAGDPLGQMTQGEGTLITGTGSQTGGLVRWGDYTSMSVDPTDDCTFWYTNEYLASNGSWNWHTRIGSFKLNGCGGPPAPSDFSIGANPASMSVAQGGSGSSTISTTVTSGSAQSVSLSASGVPSGTTVSFNPSSVNAGASSTMNVSVGAATATGSYTITVTGTGSSATHSTTVGLSVTAPPPNDFSIAASPSSVSIAQGSSGTSSISTSVTSGSAQTVSLSASGLPTGSIASFNPQSVTAGGSSTLTISVGAGTPTGSYSVTVTSTGTSATHSTTLALTVTAPSAGNVANGGFETGDLSGWTPSGAFTPVVAAGGHTGSYAARLGSTGPFNGNSTLTQTVVIPGGSSRLTFWYQPHCTDTITYDQIQAQIRNASGATLANVLNVCSNTGAWTQVTYDTSSFAGQTVVLWFNDHDDNYPSDPTYVLLDDVDVSTVTAPPNDFSIGASPSSVSVAQGSSGGSTISTSVTSGSAQSISLTASGAPTGTTVSFSPGSVTAGGSSTMTVNVGAGTATGSYTITVTGTGPSATHSTTVGLAVTAASPAAVQNGGFEAGNLSGWSASGGYAPLIRTTPHAGSYSAQLGSTGPVNGDSTLSQTVAVPVGATTLTFWYQPHCTDSIVYDQIQAQIRSTGGATLATALNVCSNTGAWTQVTYNVSAYAGQTVVLWFNDHDDGYASDPTYFLLDDVALS